MSEDVGRGRDAGRNTHGQASSLPHENWQASSLPYEVGMSAILGKTASQLLAGLAAREWSAVELTTAFLQQIATHDDAIKAFLKVDRKGALRQAEIIDLKRREGQPLGRLAGLPVALKDL